MNLKQDHAEVCFTVVFMVVIRSWSIYYNQGFKPVV